MRADNIANYNEALKNAEAAQELIRRAETDQLLFYKPCCRVHKSVCPVVPCPESKHWKFHLSAKNIRVVFGGNRSGKSMLGVTEILMHAALTKHPFTGEENRENGRYRIFCPDFSLVEKVINEKIYPLIPWGSFREKGANKRESFEKSYDSRYHIIHLKRGVDLDLMSYDQDVSKGSSVDLDGVWADEEMPEDWYNETQMRLLTRKGKFWLTVTPLYHLTWAMKFLEDSDPNVEVFRLEIYDNDHNSLKDIEERERSITDDNEKEARIYGRFMEFKGIVYKELRNDIHLIGSEPPKSDYPVIFALDPHPRKASVMTWAYVTPKDDVVFFDELEIKGTARDIASMIRKKERDHASPTVLRVIDPAAKAQGSDLSFETDTLMEFEREGIEFDLADNSDAGYNVVHEYLTFDPTKEISSLNRPKCFFTRDANLTWFGMTHLMWDDWAHRRSMKDEKERIKEYKKDFPDCVRYTLASRPSYRNLIQMRTVGQPIGNLKRMQEFVPEHQRFREFVLGGSNQRRI